MGTIAAALTVAVGFGMRDMVANIVAGLFILFDNPFVKGDYIRIGENEGRVSEINLRYTLLKGSSSETVEIPNGQVTSQATRNFTRGTRTKNSVEVEVKPSKVAKALEELEKSAASVEQVKSSPGPEANVKGFREAKALLELHYWTGDGDSHEEVRSKVLQEFSKSASEEELLPG